MENKLQELTQKLYEEGLSKGRNEADTLIANAKAEAKRIISEANAEADRLNREAKTNAEDLHKNSLTELTLAGKQLINKLKTGIQDMIIARTSDEAVGKASIDPKFIEQMLIAAANNWQGSSSERIELNAMIPAELKQQLDPMFEQNVKKTLDNEIEIEFSDNLKSGFKIGPKNGGYYISFTDESFDALLKEYLRPKVSEVLFGGNN